MEIKQIAHIENDLKEKFGVPRQAGLVAELRGRIVFEPEYRNADALRGLEGFSRIWLIWGFSENVRTSWSPTVRPPRLGGNKRLGVFATRSSFRPNPLALSCVEIESIDYAAPDGPVINVLGADLMNGSPIFDIKPYIPYADAFPDASEGFASRPESRLTAEIPQELMSKVPQDKQNALKALLETDPRPAYQNDPDRIYGLAFADLQVKFKVNNNILTVIQIEKESKHES